jgi:hypothetical protein
MAIFIKVFFFEIFPNYITAMYNACLRRGIFPEKWKRVKLIPITKPGKENSEDISKFRPISLLNTEGKVRIAKAFRTTSSEALCILAGTTPIIIKTEEAVKQ